MLHVFLKDNRGPHHCFDGADSPDVFLSTRACLSRAFCKIFSTSMWLDISPNTAESYKPTSSKKDLCCQIRDHVAAITVMTEQGKACNTHLAICLGCCVFAGGKVSQSFGCFSRFSRRLLRWFHAVFTLFSRAWVFIGLIRKLKKLKNLLLLHESPSLKVWRLLKCVVPAMTFLATRLRLDDDNYPAASRTAARVKTVARQASTPSRKVECRHKTAVLDLL